MASLTPLSKGLIALAVVGGMASAAWHLVLKERLGARAAGEPTAASTTDGAPSVTTVPATAAPPAPSPRTEPVPTTPASPAVVAGQGAVLSAAEHAELGRQRLAAGDYGQARVHLEQAVQAGDGGAACLLGDMTLKGQGGIPANQDEAARLFQFAQSRNIICFAVK